MFNRLGCATDAYLGVIKRLEEGKERFDRIISDKHVECREDYFNDLPKLLKSIDRNSESKIKYYKEYSSAKKDSPAFKKAFVTLMLHNNDYLNSTRTCILNRKQ